MNTDSQPFAGKNGLFPRWEIEFEPNAEEVSTWDFVFHIRERYKRDILDQDFMSWLREFSSWCRSALIVPVLDQDLIDAMRRYSSHLETMRNERSGIPKSGSISNATSPLPTRPPKTIYSD